MANKAQVEKAIFEREGFRVELELFEKRQSLPAYDFAEMAPQRWKVSDWKNARLDAYRLLAKGATIYLGDGTPSLATSSWVTCATAIMQPLTDL